MKTKREILQSLGKFGSAISVLVILFLIVYGFFSVLDDAGIMHISFG
jgi:hypothetical protein